MVWECKESLSCECSVLDFTHEKHHHNADRSLKKRLSTHHSRVDLLRLWINIVEEYSSLRLTHESDRLIALSGLAQIVAQKWNVRYIAGIWENILWAGLLWEPQAVRVRSPLRVPSWSWAPVAAEDPSGQNGPLITFDQAFGLLRYFWGCRQKMFHQCDFYWRRYTATRSSADRVPDASTSTRFMHYPQVFYRQSWHRCWDYHMGLRA